MSRNDVFDALLAVGAGLTWDNGAGFIDAQRQLKMWDKAPQPSLYQVEAESMSKVNDSPLYRTTLKANWIIYHNAGKDQSATPARTSSDILDAVEAAFRPVPAIGRMTLGGLCYRCFIDGKIHQDNGDLDGQAMIIVPISIILP